MPSLKEVKRRINSVQTTQKITSAMQKVSSAKLHLAQTALGNMLPYEERLYLMLGAFLQEEAYFHSQGYPKEMRPLMQSPLLEQRPINKVAIVVVAADSGLCGSYNANMIKQLHLTMEEYASLPKENITIYPVGNKMVAPAQKTGANVSLQFVELAEKPDYIACSSISRKLGIAFLRGQLDKVEILFYHFKNMAVQQIQRDVFLPFPISDSFKINPSFGRELHGKQGVIVPQESMQEVDISTFCDYIVEPSRQELMDVLLPKVLRFKMFRAMLDANASEHAARSMAMKVATDNADSLIADLTVLYNKSRQQAITNELLDIIGGSL